MIDAEELPSIALAYKVGLKAYTDTCRYCFNLAEQSQDSIWETALLAAAAGYVAGVRHERKRQRQKATAGKQSAPENITGQELELLAAWRKLANADRRYYFEIMKSKHKAAQKEKEPADAATRQQACKE